MTTIEGGAYSNCSSLTTLTIGDNVKTIGDWAFSDCSSLTSVTIPNSVTSIGHQVFENCTGLTSVTVGNNVSSIGFKAFYNCSSLNSITLGKSVPSIGNQAFEGCLEIAYVNLNCESVDNWFSGFVKISEVVVGNNVREIGANAFFGCSGLTSITIGTGVSRINEKAFASCPELTNVYCYRENHPYTSMDAFEDSYIEYATLHVLEPYIHSYDNVRPWSLFGNIEVIEKSKYKLTYIIDGEEYKTSEIKEGETIIVEPAPTKEGYFFSGWNEVPEKMPSNNVTVTGTYILCGDVNVDGKVNASDIVETINYINGNPSMLFNKKAAELNGDNVVDNEDIYIIEKIIMKKE